MEKRCVCVCMCVCTRVKDVRSWNFPLDKIIKGWHVLIGAEKSVMYRSLSRVSFGPLLSLSFLKSLKNCYFFKFFAIYTNI